MKESKIRSDITKIEHKVSNTLLKMWWQIDERLFPITQRFGFHITKTHFYSPIPNTNELDDSLWKKRFDFLGVNTNDSDQLNLLTTFASKYRREYDTIPTFGDSSRVFNGYSLSNRMFGSVDGEILYCMIRHLKPRRVIEIGSGISTLLISSVLKINFSENNIMSTHTAFDPYAAITKGRINVFSDIEKTKAQDVSIDRFQELKENDLLFIDSSHILKIGSDVQYLYNEVLPRLNKGVVIHSHDIYLPEEYPKDSVKKDHCFSTEQYLLQAFLTFNDRFKVLWGSNYMRLQHPNILSDNFRSFDPNTTRPESFWIQRIKE